MLSRLLRACLLAGLLGACAPLYPSPLPSPSPVAASPLPAPVGSPTPTPSPSPRFRLYFGDDPPDGTFLSATLAASEDWNRALGWEVFTWHEGRPVRLAQYKRIERAVLATIIAGVTFREFGLVAFSGETPATMRYAVAAHEFGHVLGVSHSTDPLDLMFPTNGQNGAITAADARRAREALSAKEAP